MFKTKKYLSYALSIVFLVLPIFLILNWRNIYDWARLYGYKPPQRIEAMASATTMNGYGKRLFYVNHPLLSDRTMFNDNCRDDEQSIVIGCFVDGKGIFIYDVQDKRLSGIHEVTAAHEMLHAAYERLSPREKDKVNRQLDETYKALKDQRILKTIQAYKDKDESSVPSEMHSIFGTEVRTLPQELENYYKKYFTNRQAVVALSEKYEQEFNRREELVKHYDAQLENLKQQINKARDNVEYQIALIKNEKAVMDQLLSTKDYDGYNVRVDQYNQKVNSVEAQIVQTNNLITRYNDILAKRNEIALQQQELIKAIDSRVPSLRSQ